MSLSGYLRLLRWPGALTAAANVATGFLLSHEPASPGGFGALTGACLGGTLVYLGGVALNDVADAERDQTLHPERPIPAGLVTRARARRFAVALIAAGVAVAFALAGRDAALLMSLAAAAAVAYDVVLKRWRVPGALAMGLARGANAAAGLVAAELTFGSALAGASAATMSYPIGVLGYTVMLTFASTFEERRPTAFMAGTTVVLLLLPAALAWPHFDVTWKFGPAFALVPLALTLIAGAREALVPDGPGMGAVIRRAVFGFLLVDAAWLLGAGRYDTGVGLLLVYLALRFGLARARS